MRECGRRAGLVEALGAASRTCIHPFKSTAGSREKRGSPREQHKALFPNIKAKSRCSIQSLLTKKQKRDTNVEMFISLSQGTWQHVQAERVHVSHLSSRERKGHKRERGNKEKETDLVSFFPLQHAHFSVDLLIYFSWCGSVLSNNTCHQEKERLEETREKGTKGERNVCGQERFPSYTKPVVATTFSTRSEDRCGCVWVCVKNTHMHSRHMGKRISAREGQ